jgi:hypothetical protein
LFACVCGRASHLNEFCFRLKRIEKMHFQYVRNSYRDGFFDFSPRSYSRSSSRTSSRVLSYFSHGSIIHMVLVHERTALYLDALVTAHVLIMVIVPHVGMVFLLEGLTPALSSDT